MNPLVHPVTYPIASHDPRRWSPEHLRRDAMANRELENALAAMGFEHGEAIFNQPPFHTTERPLRGSKPYTVDLSFVRPGSLLLQATRPPISDLRSGPRRKLARARTDFEEVLFAAWRRFLEVSSRAHVIIHEDMHPYLKPEFTSRREMTFYQKGWGAPYYRLNAHEGKGWEKWKKNAPRRTSVFFLRLEEAWPKGPGYVCAFGMSGFTSLIWAYRLARDFSWILEKPGFFVAELELGMLPQHLTDLRWCEDWKIEPILEHRFDGSSGLEAAG